MSRLLRIGLACFLVITFLSVVRADDQGDAYQYQTEAYEAYYAADDLRLFIESFTSEVASYKSAAMEEYGAKYKNMSKADYDAFWQYWDNCLLYQESSSSHYSGGNSWMSEAGKSMSSGNTSIGNMEWKNAIISFRDGAIPEYDSATAKYNLAWSANSNAMYYVNGMWDVLAKY